jgi:hypothetical protein
MHLHYTVTTASTMATALVKRMETERDSRVLSELGKALGALGAKLEPRDVQSGAAALVKRMETERDSRVRPGLGKALGDLSARLEPRDAQPLAAALVKQVETEQDTRVLSELGKALGALGARLEPRDAQPLAATLWEFIEDTDGGGGELLQAWINLERVAKCNLSVSKCCEKYVKVLQLPLVTNEHKKAALDGLETLIGETLNGNLWRFVNWATTSEKAKSWGISLSSGRPYRVVEGSIQGSLERRVHKKR